jgi:hypothetical protein
MPKEMTAPVSYDWEISQSVVDNNGAVANDFLSGLTIERKCIILTMVPTVDTKIGNVSAIAEAAGLDLVNPETQAGLRTNDGSHLDEPSAEKWSRAFFQSAGSRIRSCL